MSFSFAQPLRFAKILWMVVLAFVVSSALWAAHAAEPFDQQVRDWEKAVNAIEKRVDSGRTGSLEERDLRAQLKSIADAAVNARDNKARLARQTQSLLDSLGPAPGENDPKETKAVQKRREDLTKELRQHEGYSKQAGLIVARTDNVVSKITTRSRERLKGVLFERGVSPLDQKAWAIAVPEALKLAKTSFVDAPLTWLMDSDGVSKTQGALLRNGSIAILAGLVGWWFGVWIRRHFGRVRNQEAPSYARRLIAGIVEGLGRTLGPIMFVVLFSGLMFSGDGLEDPLKTVVDGLVRNLVVFFFGYGLINAVLNINRQEWRLLDFNVASSRRLSRRLKIVLVMFLVFKSFHQATAWATPSAELDSVFAAAFTIVMTPFLVSLLSTRIWGGGPKEEEADQSQSFVSRLRTFTSIGVLIIPFIAIVGYPGLASYLISSLILSALMLAGLGLLRSVGHETLASFFNYSLPIGRKVRTALALNSDASRHAVFWLKLTFDFVLLVAAAALLLSVWGLGAEESAVSLGKLMRGLEIGPYTLSLVDIFLGLFLFALIIFVTRLIQKGLERHILPNLTKDKGVQDALKTGVGYIGAIIGFLVAVAVLGLDLTNLALIAGALSVGLGFGLQNIVNNFVSGLILLAERPIKPGDWVVVGGLEGNVKKVNVRSTEIETFQRASVIIPNADLISSPVTNWTHKNMLGRVEVPVGVSYSSDPKQIEEILLACAKAHNNVISTPQPYVLFSDFADSSLNFELRAYVADVEKRLLTASDLRFAIFAAFAEAGVEIPFPQRVVHLGENGALKSDSVAATADGPDGER